MKVLKSKYFYYLVAVVLIAIFWLQNFRPVNVTFLFWDVLEVNFLALVIGFLVLGYIIGFLNGRKMATRKAFKNMIDLEAQSMSDKLDE